MLKTPETAALPSVEVVEIDNQTMAQAIYDFTTANRGPVGLNWGWYQNKELDELAKLGDKFPAQAEVASLLKSL